MAVEHDPIKTAPHQMEENSMPLWQKILGTAFLIIWTVVVFFWHGRLSGDFWPPDRSLVGPNLVASFILYSLGIIVAALLWPPTRRRMHRFVDRKLAPIHEHLTVLRQHHESHANDLQQIKDKLEIKEKK